MSSDLRIAPDRRVHVVEVNWQNGKAMLRIVGEVESCEPHAPKILQAMKGNVAKLQAGGAPIID